MDQQPAFIFYPRDWLNDDKLKLCSFATKGAWMDILCMMYESKKKGYLIVNGKALDKEGIRQALKCQDIAEFENIWTELMTRGVMSVDSSGAYYSKRMVKDIEQNSPRMDLSEKELQLIDVVLINFNTIAKQHVGYNVNEAKDLIALRIKQDKATLSDFINVIHSKYEQWKDDDKMKWFIKPSVIFGIKFDKYRTEALPIASLDDGRYAGTRFDYDNM